MLTTLSIVWLVGAVAAYAGFRFGIGVGRRQIDYAYDPAAPEGPGLYLLAGATETVVFADGRPPVHLAAGDSLLLRLWTDYSGPELYVSFDDLTVRVSRPMEFS